MHSEHAPRSRTLRLGTRGSQLARWQAEWVAGELRSDLGTRSSLSKSPRTATSIAPRPIEEIGTRGVFTKAIQQALLAGEVDLAVHSLKDLPTEPVEGLNAWRRCRSARARRMCWLKGRGVARVAGEERESSKMATLVVRVIQCWLGCAGGAGGNGQFAAAGAVAACAAGFASGGSAWECRHAAAETG